MEQYTPFSLAESQRNLAFLQKWVTCGQKTVEIGKRWCNSSAIQLSNPGQLSSNSHFHLRLLFSPGPGENSLKAHWYAFFYPKDNPTWVILHDWEAGLPCLSPTFVYFAWHSGVPSEI